VPAFPLLPYADATESDWLINDAMAAKAAELGLEA
jgi:hypothetical protein